MKKTTKKLVLHTLTVADLSRATGCLATGTGTMPSPTMLPPHGNCWPPPPPP